MSGRAPRTGGGARGRWWLAAWTLAILVGAVLVRPLARSWPAFRAIERHEIVHIAAHLVLYAGLAILARRAGLSWPRAAALTMAIAVVQEAVQVAFARRAPNHREVFDLLVDAVAIGVVFVGSKIAARRRDEEPAAR